MNCGQGSDGCGCLEEEGRKESGRPGASRLWSPTFVAVVAFSLCSYMVAQGLNSGTTVYLDGIGMPAVYAGIMATAFSLPAGIARLLSGPVVDGCGRMRVARVGAVMLLVGTGLPLVSENLAVLTVARAFQGVGFSVTSTAAATAAVDVLPKSRLGEGVGYSGLAQSFGFAVGPSLALFLVSLEPSVVMYAGLSAVAVLALVFSFAIEYEKAPFRLPAESTYRTRFERGEVPYADSLGRRGLGGFGVLASSLKSFLPTGEGVSSSLAARVFSSVYEKSALAGAIPMFVLCPVYGFCIYFMGLYGTSLGVEAPGVFFTVSAVMMVVVRASSGRYMDSVKPICIFAVAVASGIIAYLLLIASEGNQALFYVAGLFYGVSLGVAFPVLATVAVANTRPQRWGVANAMVGVATDVGIGLSAIVWGLLSDTFGFRVTLWCVVALFVVAFLVAIAAFPRTRAA